MQVFIPFVGYNDCAKCLDNKRLGNQIYRECKIILNGGWPNHPISKIWKNHKFALCQYALAGLKELRRRGKPYPNWEKYFKSNQRRFKDNGRPNWSLNPEVHSSHKANLYFKDPIHYSQFKGEYDKSIKDEKGKPEYVWAD